MYHEPRLIWQNCQGSEVQTFATCETPSETPKALGFTAPGRKEKVFLPKSQISVAVTQPFDPKEGKEWVVKVPKWLAAKDDCADLLDAYGLEERSSRASFSV